MTVPRYRSSILHEEADRALDVRLTEALYQDGRVRVLTAHERDAYVTRVRVAMEEARDRACEAIRKELTT